MTTPHTVYAVARFKGGDEDGPMQALVGATILSNNPLWATPRAEQVITPMLFRALTYAEWVMGIARRKDVELGDEGWNYMIRPVEFKL